ncbi:MAG: PD-(D/E)XK nuclease family protein [Solirubrobacteraceae bacterium]
MALTLVLGPANSAKAGEVLGAFEAAARRGALLVVPTAPDVAHYARELAGDGVVLGSVLTFGGLVAEIGRRAGYGGRRLTELQRERVLDRVLAALSLEPLRASAQAAGFTRAAAELIGELQRDLVAPARFAAALRAWAARDVRRAPYARDVGRLYGDYVRELDCLGCVDSELYAWRALDALRAAPGRWGSEPVYFYGFDDLTALERDAVETLARVVGAQVTVSLTYEPGREALVARAEAVEALRPLASTVRQLPPQDEHYAPGSRAVLHHLERSLFSGGGERIEPGAAIELLEAGGELAEAELVGERVLELLRAGVPGDEIAIVYRSRRHAAPLVARVFDQYGIPLSAPTEIPLGHTPLGRAVLGAARCALVNDGSASAQDLLDYLRAPGLLAPADPAPPVETADRLEARIRREGLRTAAQARAALGGQLTELDALAGAADAGAALCVLARRLFAAPHRAGAPVLTDEEELDARALARLVGAVQELRDLEPAHPAPPAAELIELLARLPVAASAPAVPGRVLLADPLEVRARRFRAVFVCGLQEGEFPAPSRPEPFLSDERRHELAAASGLALRPREDGLAAERYLFYSALSRATERVFLAYRSSDEEGNLALPSPFIADVAELLSESWAQRRVRRLLADVVWEPGCAPTARELRRALAAGESAVAGEAPAQPRVLGARALASVRHSHILSAGALEAYGDCAMRWLVERELRPQPLAPEPDPITRGNLMHAALERVLSDLGEPITASSLPAAHAILDERLAELAAVPGALPAPGAPEVVQAGALRAIAADLHRYLEHEAAGAGGWRPYRLELGFGFGTGEDDTVDGQTGDGRTGEDNSGDGETGDARTGADDTGDGETGGGAADGCSLPPLALGEGEDRVLVRGKIDRVDVDGRGHAVVRDYTSGAARPEQASARWSADRRLQVALYMLAVRELVGLQPVAGFYQPLRGDDLRARGVFIKGTEVGCAHSRDAREAAELDELLDDAAARAVTLGRALRSGWLTPCPQTCSRDGCAFPGICRSQ